MKLQSISREEAGLDVGESKKERMAGQPSPSPKERLNAGIMSLFSSADVAKNPEAATVFKRLLLAGMGDGSDQMPNSAIVRAFNIQVAKQASLLDRDRAFKGRSAAQSYLKGLIGSLEKEKQAWATFTGTLNQVFPIAKTTGRKGASTETPAQQQEMSPQAKAGLQRSLKELLQAGDTFRIDIIPAFMQAWETSEIRGGALADSEAAGKYIQDLVDTVDQELTAPVVAVSEGVRNRLGASGAEAAA